MGIGNLRNRKCPCGSGRKYKKCCFLNPSPMHRIDTSPNEAYFVSDISKALESLYAAYDFTMDVKLIDLASKFKLSIPKRDSWMYDTFSSIKHPLLHQMRLVAQIREQGLQKDSHAFKQLCRVAFCFEYAKYRHPKWAEDVLKRIAKIPPKKTSATKEYAACLAELEHLILLMGNGFSAQPLIPDKGFKIRTPESFVEINQNKIGIEVCAPANIYETEKRLAQCIAERLYVKLDKSKWVPKPRQYDLVISFGQAEEILQNCSSLLSAIGNGINSYKLGKSTIHISNTVPCNDLEKLKHSLEETHGFAGGMKAIYRSKTKRIECFSNSGLYVTLSLETNHNERKKIIISAIKNAIKEKLSKKQIDMTQFDFGLLALRVPHDYRVNSKSELKLMKADFDEYAVIAKEAIKLSSRYKAVLLFTTEPMKSKGNRSITTIRGRLVEIEPTGFNRKYFETVIENTSFPLQDSI